MGRPFSSCIVGKVMDRALVEIKDGDHNLFMRILNKTTGYKLMPIAYKVDRETGCWLCISCAGSPYPHVRFNGKTCKVSRLIFEEFTGIAPGYEMVLHKCDNPGCINPSHLYLGTAKDNVWDWMVRGKSPNSSQHKPLYKMRKSVSPREYWEKRRASKGQRAQNSQENAE